MEIRTRRTSLAFAVSALVHLVLLSAWWAWSSTRDDEAGATSAGDTGGGRLMWIASVDSAAAETAPPAPTPPVSSPPPPPRPTIVIAAAKQAAETQPTLAPTRRSAPAEQALDDASDAIASAPADPNTRSRSDADAVVGVPGGGSGSGSADSGRGNNPRALAAYRAALSARVQSLLRIPFIAKRRAFVESDEAQVVVRIVLDPSGALLRLELSAGSGFASLDQNALDTVRLAAPFGPLPTGTPSDKLDFDLPVQYVR